MNVAQHVFGVGKLASDGVDAVASHDVGDKAEAGSGFNRLLLLGVAKEYDLGAAFLGELEDAVGVSCRKLAGLFHDDDGFVVEVELVVGRPDE